MTGWSMRVAALACLGATLWFSAPFSAAEKGTRDGEWRYYAGDLQATKYSPLKQISAENIDQLEVVWRWVPAADRRIQSENITLRSTRYQDTPLMVDGVLYTVTPLGMVAALDPATGQEKWLYDPEVYKEGKPGNSGFIHRGLAYWTDGRAERILHGTNDAYLISIDVKTGKPDPAFGEGGRVDLAALTPRAVRRTQFMGRRPMVVKDMVIAINSTLDLTRTKEMPPGDVHAFNVRTGRLLWEFHPIPRRGEFGYETWEDGSAEYTGNANIWAGVTYDPDLDYLYLPGSGATGESYGAHRLGNNLFAESLICLEAKTGKRVWHYQIVHHGLWDYDLPAQPVLGDITVNGRRIKAVMQVSKQGFTYVFDRKTGKPVWPIEERPVPQSTVPGERTSPTQPFPTKPPAFALQGAVEQNLIDFTPELRKRAVEQLQQFEHGPLFTPPSEKGTLFIPGLHGGALWGGAAFDPDTGLLYVPSILEAGFYRLGPADPKQTNFRYSQIAAGKLADMMWVEGLSIFRPPYSKVTAYDMSTGEILWETPLGNGPRNHPLLRDLKLPPLGDDVKRPGVLVTKTLLFVSAQRHESLGNYVPPRWAKYGDPDMNQKLIFVFDKKTGKLLREIKVDGLSAAPPMTYLHRGRQYIVTAAGSAETSELVALSLPEKRTN